MMDNIKAIETSYRGYRFRSRLEARWAVFFDSLRIPWEYEKEGFSLKSGSYLPDFWLPSLECWAEIKPYGSESALDLLRQLSFATKRASLLICGTPGDEKLSVFCADMTDGSAGEQWWGSEYKPVRWTVDIYAQRICICSGDAFPSREFLAPGFSESFRGMIQSFDCLLCRTGEHAGWAFIQSAYDAARGARFEHGENPAADQKQREESAADWDKINKALRKPPIEDSLKW